MSASPAPVTDTPAADTLPPDTRYLLARAWHAGWHAGHNDATSDLTDATPGPVTPNPYDTPHPDATERG